LAEAEPYLWFGLAAKPNRDHGQYGGGTQLGTRWRLLALVCLYLIFFINLLLKNKLKKKYN
jgi:hypothetical protein